MKIYRINEIFYSLQGEGIFTGTAAVFIRFSGCNLACPFCDTEHQPFTRMERKDIIREIDRVCDGIRPALCVLTGGEPTLQVDPDLLTALHGRFRKVAIETNGTRDVIPGFDLITISPKDCFVENAALAVQTSGAETECKVVFDGKNNPERYFEIVQASHYYLQPCDTGDPARNAEILAAAVEHIKTHPWWRLSLQTQKIINVR